MHNIITSNNKFVRNASKYGRFWSFWTRKKIYSVQWHRVHCKQTNRCLFSSLRSIEYFIFLLLFVWQNEQCFDERKTKNFRISYAIGIQYVVCYFISFSVCGCLATHFMMFSPSFCFNSSISFDRLMQICKRAKLLHFHLLNVRNCLLFQRPSTFVTTL